MSSDRLLPPRFAARRGDQRQRPRAAQRQGDQCGHIEKLGLITGLFEMCVPSHLSIQFNRAEPIWKVDREDCDQRHNDHRKTRALRSPDRLKAYNLKYVI